VLIIKNIKQLAQTKQRKRLLEVLELGYQAINLRNVLKNKLRVSGGKLFIGGKKINLKKYDKIAVCGIGKCSLAAAEYLEKILGPRISGGMVIDVKSKNLKKIKVIKGSHPLPSIGNTKATEKMLRFIKSLNPKKDLLIFIVSGGGSSLFFWPDGIKPEDFIGLSLDLLKSGATIQEFNCVRKHLSLVQGGKLAALIYPQKTLALYFSDVISETDNKNLTTVASGPLFSDNQTNKDAEKILKKYRLWSKYKNKIEYFSETVKNKSFFRNIGQNLLLTNDAALSAMRVKAEALGFKPTILSKTFSQEANLVFRKIRQAACATPEALARRAKKDRKHDLFIVGGEMTINVRGRGKGGRNQQAVLKSLTQIRDNEVFICAASDGVDNTEFAGAVSDKLALAKAKKLGLDAKKFLKNNDSFNFFKKTKDYIKTGKTGTNVADLILYYRGQ
jgi:glycerate-2-kinase